MLSPIHRRGLSLAAMFAVLVTSSASALRVMSYNLLNYSSGRSNEFRMVLGGTDPDILVVEEILSQAAVNTFLADVLQNIEPGQWAAGEFVNGPDTDNGIFYKPARVQYIDHYVIHTALRDIDEWTVRPVGYSSDAASIRIYAVHLKASTGTTNEQARLAEVTLMRNRMETFPAGQSYIVTGDFNIYTSSESAYQYLLSASPGPAGVVVDPINRPGSWHANVSFADIHTQSPRTTQFGGGANGGLDDRFDMLLTGPALLDGEGFDYIPGTYTAYGQDGLHYDRAIIDLPPNAVVSQEMAQAIHDASDHLPLFAEFQLAAILVADAALDLGTVIVGGPATETLTVSNGASAPADDLDYTLAAPAGFAAPPGPFSAAPEAGSNLHVIDMSTTTAGLKSGFLTISSDAPDDPIRPVPLAGIVLDHGVPSTDPAMVATTATLDFGTHAPGGFDDLPATIHNHGFGAFQALVEVYDAMLTGDPRFSIVGGFSPAAIGDTPGSWSVTFDDADAPDGEYTATLTFSTRDQQDLAGAIELDDIVFTLRADVDGGVIAVAQDPLRPTAVGFQAIAPNPFGPHTTITFGLAEPGQVTLTLYDVTGRQIRSLVEVPLSSGDHHVAWDGRDDAGRDVGAGVFYARLQGPGVGETRMIVRLR